MTRRCGRWGLVLLAGLALSAPGVAQEPGDGRGAADLIPLRRFQPLGGKAVGLLVGGDDGVLVGEGRRGPADALWFSTGGASYRAVYVPVPKRFLIGGLNIPIGERGEKTHRFNKLSPATLKNVAPWGVGGPCALVEVEANGGLGGPAAETFVATSMRVLEGTREYPLHTARVVEDLRRQFRLHLKEQQNAIALGLSEARARKPAGYRLLAGREQEQTVYLTWLPETKQLRAVFRERICQKAVEPEDRAAPPPREPGEPPQPPRRAGVLLGVQVGMAYTVSREGIVEHRRPLAPEVVVKEFSEPLRPPTAATSVTRRGE